MEISVSVKIYQLKIVVLIEVNEGYNIYNIYTDDKNSHTNTL